VTREDVVLIVLGVLFVLYVLGSMVWASRPVCARCEVRALRLLRERWGPG
jgi:uncharacterized membrane protein